MNRSFLGPREGFSLLLTQLITISGLDSSLPFLHPTWLFDSQTKCSSCSRLLPQMTSLSQASVLPASSLQVIPIALLSLLFRCSIPEAQAHLAAAPSVCEAVRSALTGPGRKCSAEPLETLEPALQ